jgi:nitroreductase
MTSQPTYLQDLIISRRTIHNFIPDKIPDNALIKEAIKIACWAPNHHLTEPWRFYLLGKETICNICELNKAMMVSTKGVDSAEEKYRRWLDIPGWLIVTCQRSEDDILYREDYAACCCVIQNLMLYLWSNGVGTKWSTGAVTQDDRCYDITWIDRKSENIIGLIWYGYPAETPKTLRKNLEQVLIELP